MKSSLPAWVTFNKALDNYLNILENLYEANPAKGGKIESNLLGQLLILLLSLPFLKPHLFVLKRF